ncbi:plant intracellular Ras-group-related LRR protein 4-like [Olea europaea var. sylvestris]|uniref:plant intracellular Ras-group-related LRR protein 4-like n=1 Tax=Olea europaea var. sylvestris TaxID=158386 RepID=UPI000C1D639C|nr:plant intracellular Ras-group-related LRR protein 4-like [Olea europaea var. sylvestris]
MEYSVMTVDQVVEEIMRIHRSLPGRPGIDDVEAAKTLIRNLEREDQLRLEAVARQSKGKDVPEELFKVLQEIQRNFIHFQSAEQKREALKLLDLEGVHLLFDDLIQRASKCLGSNNSRSGDVSYSSSRNSSSLSLATTASFTVNSFNSPATLTTPTPTPTAITTTTKSSSLSSSYNEKERVKASELFSKDDCYLKKTKTVFQGDGFGIGARSGDVLTGPQIVDSTLKPAITSGQDGDKMSLIKLASLIEVSAKKGTRELNLQHKLAEQIEWLPDSIGKLFGLINMNLSDNRILVLPETIGRLSSLEMLDLHGNKISELPESIGDLLNLVHLNLSGNQLKTLPPTIGKLVRLQDLDLSSNGIMVLPETIGSLVSLKKLNVETNDIEEIPHTIGRCTSLEHLHADYNRLKALPEAVGKIGSLEVLTVRYNNIKQLPTTMASLSSLRELDVSFNELESVPESLCFATTLVKMNISNNFADLQFLPRSIGNLESLEELDMSNNQIRSLPDSFRMLTRLRVLNVEGNPLAVPPRNIIENGAQAVVQYMANLVAQRDVKSQPVNQKKSWAQICCFSRSNKRKRNGMDYAKA